MSNKSEKEIIENLKDSGCSQKLIDKFLELYNKRDKVLMIELLVKYRKELLEKLHKSQREIDNLDYLIVSLKKEEKGKMIF